MATWRFHYPKRLAFGPVDFESPGLGGGESRLVVLTRGLARRGHDVEVYNATWAPGEYDGVKWIGAWDLDRARPVDVAVSVRFESSVQERSDANSHIFWMLDDRPAGASRFAELHPDGTIVIASEAMRTRLPPGLAATLIPLPIEQSEYDDASPPSLSGVCLYSSMPNRGLRAVLQMWPQVREAHPDAELHITSGWELWGYTAEEAGDRWATTFGGVELPDGAYRLGVLSRTDLLRVQKGARLGLFPTDFPEMFCLAAAELASAGRPSIASSKDALVERVADDVTGFLIEGDPYLPSVQSKFVGAVDRCLSDDALVDRLGGAARLAAADFDIERVLDRWEALVS